VHYLRKKVWVLCGLSGQSSTLAQDIDVFGLSIRNETLITEEYHLPDFIQFGSFLSVIIFLRIFP
jgi:hypothetical protein